MKVDLKGLVRPSVIEMTKAADDPYSAELLLQPLERGYGYTLGNALRRMLLSSLPGAAVWGFRLDGVVHEHQTIPGVVEDVHQIIDRLKRLTLVLAEDVAEVTLRLKVTTAGPVYASHFEQSGSVDIPNPKHLLFTLQEDREINGEFFVNSGRGYMDASHHPTERSMPVDMVRIDSIYNPVRSANFTVAETRVGQRTDYDRLTMQVETNGTITPEDAVSYAAALLQEHFRYFFEFSGAPEISGEASDPAASRPQDSHKLRELLSRPIDECGLSVRSVNSLKNSQINTLGDLVQHAEEDMLKVKNVGDKALTEIADLLRSEGLNFGMAFAEANGELVVTEAGVPPKQPEGASS